MVRAACASGSPPFIVVEPSLSAMPTSAVTPMCTGAPGAGGGAKESGALKPPASEP